MYLCTLDEGNKLCDGTLLLLVVIVSRRSFIFFSILWT